MTRKRYLLCVILLVSLSLLSGCFDQKQITDQKISPAELKRQLPELASYYEEATNSHALYPYEQVEFQVERSYFSELNVLHSHKPIWSKLAVHSDDVGFNEADMDALKPIANLDQLHVPWISPKAFVRLNELPSLNEFYVSNTRDFHSHLFGLDKVLPIKVLGVPITKSIGGLGHKMAMYLPNLTWLNLTGTDITDEDLKSLAKLKKLEYLHLDKTEITDVGIRHLKQCSSLKIVFADQMSLSTDIIGEIHFELRQ